uniref:C-CAP/cofactor C-like domain-containing protein n=1 Tax=Acrobeloides nanus TaxID=290746 RepID=A0A914BVV7_9BILA
MNHSASVTVDDCTDCLIIIGPCKGSVFIRDCKSCLVYAICQQFRTRDCELGVFLFCSTAPIIEESTVEFFPLMLYYNKIGEHMNSAGLSPFTNLWSRVHDFTPNGRQPRFILYKEPTPGSLSDFQKSKISKIFGIEGLSFHEDESFLFVTEADRNPDPSMERVLVLFKMVENTPIEKFYAEAVLFLRDLTTKHHLKLLTTNDFVVQKGELQTILQSKSVKHSGRIITMEITGRDVRAILSSTAKQLSAKDVVEIVAADKTSKYKEKLYRLAEVQNSV